MGRLNWRKSFKSLLSQLPRGAVVLGALSVLNVGLGFVREVTIAFYFGAGLDLDSFLVALTLPVLTEMAASFATISVLLPAYVGYRETGRPQEGTALVQKWFWFAAVVCGAFCLVLAVFAKEAVSLIAPGLSETARAESAWLLRLLLPYPWIMSMSHCFSAVMQSHRSFALPALGPACLSLGVIAMAATQARTLGTTALALGYLAGSAAAFGLQWRGARGYEPRVVTLAPATRGPKLPLKGAGLMLVHSLAGQFDKVIDRGFASLLPVGSISALNYASRLVAVFSTVFSSVLATALFPNLATLTARGQTEAAFRMARKWVWVTVVLGLLPAAVLIFLRVELISLLLQRGQFDRDAVQLSASVMTVLPLMILLTGSSAILTRLLLSQKRVVFVGALAVAAVAGKFLFSAVLIRPFGLVGIALATVAVASLTTGARYWWASRESK